MIFSIPSVIVVALAKTGLYVAKKQKWLPKNFYHRLSLDSLRQGDFEAAVKYNSLARQKDPDYEKALIVYDLLRMNRDAHLEEIRSKAEEHMLEIWRLRQQKQKNLKQLKYLNSRKQQTKQGLILIFLVAVIIFSVSFTLDIQLKFQNLLWIIPALFSILFFLYITNRALKNSRDLLKDNLRKIREIKLFDLDFENKIMYHEQALKKLGEDMIQIQANSF